VISFLLITLGGMLYSRNSLSSIFWTPEYVINKNRRNVALFCCSVSFITAE
jgi:hypothetical protein